MSFLCVASVFFAAEREVVGSARVALEALPSPASALARRVLRGRDRAVLCATSFAGDRARFRALCVPESVAADVSASTRALRRPLRRVVVGDIRREENHQRCRASTTSTLKCARVAMCRGERAWTLWKSRRAE